MAKLMDMTVDSIVKIKENGQPADFIVIKHEPNAKTLVLRKDLHSEVSRSTKDSSYDYENCEMDTFLNSTYLNSIDENIRKCIVEQSWGMAYWDKSAYENKVRYVKRKICIPSIFDYKREYMDDYVRDGWELTVDQGEKYSIAYLNGRAATHWTRGLYCGAGAASKPVCILENGYENHKQSKDNHFGARPMFFLDGSKISVSENGELSISYPLHGGISGAVRNLEQMPCGVNGGVRALGSILAGVNGASREIFKG